MSDNNFQAPNLQVAQQEYQQVQQVQQVQPGQQAFPVQQAQPVQQVQPPVQQPVPVAPPLEVVDPSVTKLSTGVKVRIAPIHQRFLTQGMVNIFQSAKLDKDGNIITEGADVSSQLALANQIQRHHETLLSFGVTLVGKISDYYGVGIPRNWLNQLTRSGIDLSKYDLSDTDDIDFVFLRHFAFASDNDWAVLNSKAVASN